MYTMMMMNNLLRSLEYWPGHISMSSSSSRYSLMAFVLSDVDHLSINIWHSFSFVNSSFVLLPLRINSLLASRAWKYKRNFNENKKTIKNTAIKVKDACRFQGFFPLCSTFYKRAGSLGKYGWEHLVTLFQPVLIKTLSTL